VTPDADETPESPEQRLARWTAADAAIGLAAENEQLRVQLTEAEAEIADLRVRLQQLTTRVGQAQADNVVAARMIAARLYRRARAVAGRLRR